MSNQSKKDFFTLESREKNRYSNYPKKFKLFTRAGKYLPTARYIFDKEECPQIVGFSFDFKYSGTPTPEQKHITDVITKRIKDFNYGCGLIVMGTGKGKSHVALQICDTLKAKTLILCHNIQTLREMTTKFKEFTNISPGVYYGMKKDIKEITITTHKSFILEGGQIGDFELIIYDECDVSVDKNMFEALANSGANYLYGMTGTPYKKELNTEDMEKIFGKKIQCMDIAKYNILPEKVFIYRYKSNEPYIYENWAEQREEMFNNKERLEYQVSIIKTHIQGANAGLILSERIEEVNNLFKEINNAGVQTGIITGETKEAEDKKTIAMLEAGEIQAIVATTGKVARGVDIPIIDTVFMFASVYFQGTIIQAVGRALRSHKDKKRVHIIDFADDECKAQRYQRTKSYRTEYSLSPEAISIIKQQ